jgi:nitrogen-specific signal transduction histidine kinase/ActR/RegA family two-component response regulator
LNAIGIIWEDKPAVLNFLRDITHQKKIEAKLLQSQKMEAIGNLAGGIAHDFNNILASIIGFTELVLEDVDKNKIAADNLNEVLTAGKRAKSLVQQILTFARQSDEKKEPVVVSAIAKEVLKLIRSSIPTTIEIQSEINSTASILGNPIQVHQIIMNLCTNAAYAMAKYGGKLNFQLSEVRITDTDADLISDLPAGTYLKLSVSDTGCGIRSEILNTIFDPFFTTKGPGAGTGMGLSVVQGIVDNYGGTISIESELKKGTTVTVYLPTTNEQAGETSPSVEDFSPCCERILFVDDEMPIVTIGRRILERQGYKVTTQTSSIEALKLFSSHPDEFDLVVTDLTMPKLTGDQLARELKKIRPNIPVVLCTGYSKQIDEKMAAEIGIKAFAYSPIVKKELTHTIRKVLDEAAGTSTA